MELLTPALPLKLSLRPQMALARSMPRITIMTVIWMSSPHQYLMIRSPGTKAMAPLTPALPLELSLRPQMALTWSTPQISITMVIWIFFLHQQAMIRSPGTKMDFQLLVIRLLALQLLPHPLMSLAQSTLQISTTMAIWMSFPPRTMTIRSPGTRAMALLTPALPHVLFPRPLMQRFLSTLQISIMTAIWMSSPPRTKMIRSPGTKTMALLTPALPHVLFPRPQTERGRSTLQISIMTAIWMSFLLLSTMIRSPGTRAMAPQTPALPHVLFPRPLMQRL